MIVGRWYVMQLAAIWLAAASCHMALVYNLLCALVIREKERAILLLI